MDFFIWCTLTFSHSESRGTDLETGEAYLKIHWSASWDCIRNYYTAHAVIGTTVALYDRTPGHDDQYLGDAGTVNGTDNPSGSGDIFIYDDDFPGTQQVEVTVQGSVQMTGVYYENTWQQCTPSTGMRFVVPCQGIGTQLLTFIEGTNNIPTQAQEKVRGGCYWPDRGYYTYGIGTNGFALFSFWGMQRCVPGPVQVHMQVGLYKESAPNGPAIVTYTDDAQVTQLNPLVVGKGIVTGSHVHVGDRVKIVITTTLVAPGAASWTSNNTPSHVCVGDGTDTLNCTDTYPVFSVPPAGK